MLAQSAQLGKQRAPFEPRLPYVKFFKLPGEGTTVHQWQWWDFPSLQPLH